MRIRIKTETEYGLLKASGYIWDSGFVDSLRFKLIDENGDDVDMSQFMKDEYEAIKEIAETAITDRYYNPTLFDEMEDFL